MNIFIGANYNVNNGDRAVLEATVSIINKIWPNANITVSSIKPNLLEDARFTTIGWPLKDKRYARLIFKIIVKAKIVPVLKYMYRIICDDKYVSSLTKSDFVLISGGHHLTDILGDYSYSSLALNYLIPIYLKKRVYLLPQSIGPISKEKMWLIKNTRYILNNVKSIAYRDEASKVFLDSLNITRDYCYVPDLVFSMTGIPTQERDEKKIGIALYHNFITEDRKLNKPFIFSSLQNVIKSLYDKGYEIHFIPMDSGDKEYAEQLLSGINLSLSDRILIDKPLSSDIYGIIKLFCDKKVVLAYKTHSVIFSVITKTPVVAVAYHPKSIEFMNSIGLSQYAVNDYEANSDIITTLIDDAINNAEQILLKENKGLKRNVDIINRYMHFIREAELDERF